MYVADIITVLRTHFIDGSASSARALVMDCVVLAQNRHHVSNIDKGSYSKAYKSMMNVMFYKKISHPF